MILGYVEYEGKVHPFIDKEEQGYLVVVDGEENWIGAKQCKETTIDKINPQHYKNGIETIDYMQAVMDKKQYEGYLRGNIIKYISRYDKKNGVEDLKKAEWYNTKLIQLLEG